MTTEERLQQVEKEVARGKRFTCWILAGPVACLGALLVLLAVNMGKQGPYAVSAVSNGVCVLDTRTGQTWVRAPGIDIDLGTPENPKNEIVKTERQKSPAP
jgi:hypothetical protein